MKKVSRLIVTQHNDSLKTHKFVDDNMHQLAAGEYEVFVRPVPVERDWRHEGEVAANQRARTPGGFNAKA